MKDDESELNIDDVRENPKEQNMLAGINKPKFTSIFQAFTGKLKQKMKAKNKKTAVKDEQPEEKAGTGTSVDQIKKRNGFSSSGETSAAKMAENKLHENLKKLQGISIKPTDMTDTAKSFASMAKDLLQNTEQDKRNS